MGEWREDTAGCALPADAAVHMAANDDLLNYNDWREAFVDAATTIVALRAERDRLREEADHLWSHINGWRGAATGAPLDLIAARDLRDARAANEAADREQQP